MRAHLSAAVFVLLLAASVSRADDNSIEMLSRDWASKSTTAAGADGPGHRRGRTILSPDPVTVAVAGKDASTPKMSLVRVC